MSVVTIRQGGRSYRISNPGGHIGEPISQGRPYEFKMLDEIRRLGLKGSALDIGAHVGNHSLYLAAICGLTVFAFEPHEGSLDRLIDNIELNEPITVFAYGVALGRPGRAVVWNPDRKMSLQEVDVDPGDAIETAALDDLVELDDLALVKIDVEGMEPDVLAGASETLRRSRPIIYSEVHTQQAVDAQREVLAPIGYRLHHYVHMGSRMACWKAGR